MTSPIVFGKEASLRASGLKLVGLGVKASLQNWLSNDQKKTGPYEGAVLLQVQIPFEGFPPGVKDGLALRDEKHSRTSL